MVGIWSGRNSARMPESNDFSAAHGQPIIVYPSCRIITHDFSLLAGGFSWNRVESEKRIQDVKLFEKESSRVSREESEDPDFTPDAGQVEFQDSTNIPTLWLRKPKTVNSGDGHVFLTDGQYFVLGGESGFKVLKMGSRNVEIEFRKSKKLYPMTRISSIKLPAN